MRLSGNKLNLAEKPYKTPTNQPLVQTVSSPVNKDQFKELPQKIERVRRRSQAPRSLAGFKTTKQSHSISKPLGEARHMTNI